MNLSNSKRLAPIWALHLGSPDHLQEIAMPNDPKKNQVA